MTEKIRHFECGYRRLAYKHLFTVHGNNTAQEIAQHYRNRGSLVRITSSSPRGYWDIWVYNTVVFRPRKK